MTCVFKRIRKGAYQCTNFLVVRSPWLNERWDGPKERFNGWRVYRSGSYIERRVLEDAFPTRTAAFDYVKRRIQQNEPDEKT